MFKKFVTSFASVVGCVFGAVGVASADIASMTAPAIETGIMEDAGTKILAAVGILVAIGMGIRLFKRG